MLLHLSQLIDISSISWSVLFFGDFASRAAPSGNWAKISGFVEANDLPLLLLAFYLGPSGWRIRWLDASLICTQILADCADIRTSERMNLAARNLVEHLSRPQRPTWARPFRETRAKAGRASGAAGWLACDVRALVRFLGSTRHLRPSKSRESLTMCNQERG